MEITRNPVGETLRLALRGRLDGAWSEHTGQALEHAVAEGWHQLELDLSEVSFLSSAGIRVLVIHYKQLHKIQGRLAVVRASREIRELLEMAGLKMLLAPESAPAPIEEVGVAVEHAGLLCEAYPLQAGARLAARTVAGESVPFPEGTFGLGHGSLGREEAAGEFLALGGAALTQPPDDTQTTDYHLSQGTLVPQVAIQSGLVVEGAFAELLRFDARESAGGSAPLSTLLELVLARSGGQSAAFAMAAESAALVGAALTAPASGGVRFEFPEIRNQLLFTAEPAWPQSAVLVVGIVSATGGGPLGAQLRPAAAEPGAPHAHVHAAAFPYRPLPKGRLELASTVRAVLEEERALGLLHLLNDWRAIGGAGQSRFNRGAIWLAPLHPSA